MYISTVNQMQPAPSVCDVESLYTSQIIYISKVNIIKKPCWVAIFFTLFQFTCSYIYHTNWTEWSELRSRQTSQLPNEIWLEIHNFVAKFTIWLTTT